MKNAYLDSYDPDVIGALKYTSAPGKVMFLIRAKLEFNSQSTTFTFLHFRGS